MAVGLIMGGTDSECVACRMSEVESKLNITINRTVTVGPAGVEIRPEGTPARVTVAAGDSPFAARIASAGAPPTADDTTVWATMQRRLDESPFGSEIGRQVRYHLPEVIELVNHHRAVMVAWQRMQGPSFLAQWIDGVRHPSQPVPKEIDGISMNSALLKLAAVLKSHGSPSLQQSIDAYGLELIGLLDRSATVDELIENVGKPVMA